MIPSSLSLLPVPPLHQPAVTHYIADIPFEQKYLLIIQKMTRDAHKKLSYPPIFFI